MAIRTDRRARPGGFRASADRVALKARGHSQRVELLDAIGEPAALVRTRDGLVVSCEVSAEASDQKFRCGALVELAAAPDGFGSSLAVARTHLPCLLTHSPWTGSSSRSPRRLRIERPIVVVHEVPSRDWRAAVFPRTFVSLEEGAEATIVEYLVSGTGSPLVSSGGRARCWSRSPPSYHSIQELDRAAWQTRPREQASLRVTRVLRSFTAALGGDYARLAHAFLARGRELRRANCSPPTSRTELKCKTCGRFRSTSHRGQGAI